MIYTYNEMLEKYKSDYQIKKAIMNCEIFKLNKGIYSDTSFANYLEILYKKFLMELLHQIQHIFIMN